MHAKTEEILTFVLIVGFITFSALSIAIIYFVSMYQKRRYIHIKEKKALQAQFSQTLLQAQLEIQEQTLKNISQEIHDNIGQALSLAKLHLNTMDIGQPGPLQEKIDDSRQLVAKAIRDLRQLSHSLNPDQISHIGLLRALEAELELIGRAGTHQTNLQVTGTPYRVDTQKELILFRIAQEALHNIIKHAGAPHIALQFRFLEEGLGLTIIDDGKGFDPTLQDTNENTKFGVGILNMHDRANLIGATFHLTSTPGTGTTISLFLSQTIKPN